MSQKIEGFSIDLDLNTLKVNSGLKDLKSNMTRMNSEMKRNMSAFDKGDRTLKKYETSLSGVTKKLDLQRQVTDKSKQSYEKMVKEHGEGSVEANKAATEYNKQAAALNNLERYVESATSELKKMKEEQRIAESGWGKMSKKFDEAGGKLVNTGDKMKNVGKSMSMYVTAPIVGLGAAAVKVGFDFSASMSNVQAISGATGGDLQSLEKKAREMGAQTSKSASDAADGMSYMALIKTSAVIEKSVA